MPCGILTLTDALFQEAYICAPVGGASPDYNSRPRGPDFHPELIPVHSPLLRESSLVSFPPLTYMLKFSGFADLTSCLESGRRVTTAGRRLREALRPTAGEQMHACMIRRRKTARESSMPSMRQRPRRSRGTLTHNDSKSRTPTDTRGRAGRHDSGRRGWDTEAGMVSGISRNRILRSSFY